MTTQLNMMDSTGDYRWNVTWPRKGTQERIVLEMIRCGQDMDTEMARQYYGIPNLQQVVYRLRKHHNWPIKGKMVRRNGLLRKNYFLIKEQQHESGVQQRSDGEVCSGSGRKIRRGRGNGAVRSGRRC